MKNIITLLSLIFVISFGYGQSLTIVCAGDTLENNTSVTFQITDPNVNNTYSVGVINTSDQDVSLRFKKAVTSVLSGSLNTFCGVGECYTGTTSDPFTVDANTSLIYPDVPTGFYVTYDAGGQIGVSTIVYTYFVIDGEGNPTGEEANVTINFDTRTSGISSNTPAQSFSLNSYPNPAISDVTIQYNLGHYNVAGAKLVIKNLVGATMYSTPITQQSDKIKVNTSDFASGIYFYSIEASGKVVATKKLLVK